MTWQALGGLGGLSGLEVGKMGKKEPTVMVTNYRDIYGDLMGFIWRYEKLEMKWRSMESYGPVEIVDLPMNSMVDLSIALLSYQRANGYQWKDQICFSPDIHL